MNELLPAMLFSAATKAGVFACEIGRPQPTDEQTAEMNRLARQPLTILAEGLPDRELTLDELEDLDAAIEGVAQGVVLRVLGPPVGVN
ncbi:MAG: hypothetical protein M3680_14585 [Myxococcota bacterium]|nr:hypothetical protein [Myxococcota bacterium]